MNKIAICYGALRSGTTVLRLMLNQHSHLTCPGESDFLVDHLTVGPDGQVHLDKDSLARDRFFADMNIPLPRSEGREALAEMLQALNPDPDKVLVLMLHRGICQLHGLFPEMSVIHFVRDPRDVARSSIGMGWAGNVYWGVDHWQQTETEWDAFEALGRRADLEMRYEALIHDPRATLQDMLSVLCLQWQDAMLEYDSQTTYEKPSTDLVDQWRRKQTPREIGLVEGRIGALLQGRGYAPSGHPVILPGAFGRCLLWASSRRFVWGNKFQRYGVRDSVLDFVARRLRMRRLARKLADRFSEIDAQHVK